METLLFSSILSSFRETRPDDPVAPPGRKFMRMELPARKSQNSNISLETTERKLEIEPEKNLVKLAAEDSVPAGWKMEKFGSELDVLLTSPQVTRKETNFDLCGQNLLLQGKLFLSRTAALEWMVRNPFDL